MVGRRYAVDGEGYSTVGRILHVAGEGDTALEPFLLPMALANDASVSDGEIVGDPTEAALVVLAAKGGLDVDGTRHLYPRLAEVPFDSEYKLMATFHEMTGRRARRRPLPRQGRTRCPARPLRRGARCGRRRPFRSSWAAIGSWRRTTVWPRQGLRVLAVASRDIEPAAFDAGGGAARRGPRSDAAGPGRDRGSAAQGGPRRDRPVQARRGSACA